MKKTLLLFISAAIIASCSKDETKTEISPVSDFTFSVDATNGKIINFQNASHYINSDSKYVWTFGDGDTSQLENPQHAYVDEGTYSVVLKVINGDLIDCFDQKIVVSAVSPDSNAVPPAVSFVYSQKGRSIIFQNASSGIDSQTTYLWSFGDGTADDDKENTTHMYASDGLYSVVFKVTSNYKSYCYSKSIFVSEADIPAFDTIAPIPSFSYYYIGNVVYFVNTSSYTTSATKYSWNFGDKVTSDKENPDHSFSDGIYNVVLKVSNSKYTLSCSKQIDIPFVNKESFDQSKRPVAKFVVAINGTHVYFQNASSNVTSNTKYYWFLGVEDDFPIISNFENTSHIYAAGDYNVVLKVTNDSISDSYSMLITIP